MRAAVVTGPGEVEVRTVPVPQPNPGQVRVRLNGCGVCASNLGPWAGPDWMEFPTAPGALGHEGWGVIDALGEGVSGLAVGEPVAALSYNAYAEYDIAAAGAVVPLTDELGTMPFPGEPLGCAMNVFARSDIRAGQTVAVVGVGFLGALLTRLAAEAGARVIAITRRPSALRIAGEMGAVETLALDDHWQIIERVRDLTGGDFCDRVIEATGLQWPLDLAGEITRERGRLVIAGYHQETRQVNMQLWNWRGLDVVNAHERDPAIYVDGVRRAVEAVRAGRLDLSALPMRRYPLERLGDALNDTRDRPDGFLKAWVAL
ncbi:zinc-binding dehydrogenase [Rhodobacteraceae bacterium MCCB 386]|nr:zinc-binding dehydrogenase [Roseitranquillus sediminis]